MRTPLPLPASQLASLLALALPNLLASQSRIFRSYLSGPPLCATFRFVARIRCCSLDRSPSSTLRRRQRPSYIHTYSYNICMFRSFALLAFRLMLGCFSPSLHRSLVRIWLRSAGVILPFSIPHIFVPSLATSLLLYVHMYVCVCTACGPFRLAVCISNWHLWQPHFIIPTLFRIMLSLFLLPFCLCRSIPSHPPFSDRENSVCEESGGEAEARKLIIMLAATKAAEILTRLLACVRVDKSKARQ